MTHIILEHSQPIALPLDRVRPSATRLSPEWQRLEREQLLALLAEREEEVRLLRRMLAGARRATSCAWQGGLIPSSRASPAAWRCKSAWRTGSSRIA